MTWRCSFSSNQFCSDRVKQIFTSLRFRAVLIEVPNGSEVAKAAQPHARNDQHWSITNQKGGGP